MSRASDDLLILMATTDKRIHKKEQAFLQKVVLALSLASYDLEERLEHLMSHKDRFIPHSQNPHSSHQLLNWQSY